MTGRHPIHTGMQHTVLYAAEPRGLSLAERLLPEHLRHLGYATHIVGKWHLGHFRREYTPQQRGFDSHLGYWTGHQDYFDHRAEERGSYGLDMRRGMEVAYDLAGQYTTDVLADESVRLIAAHNRSQPLFLYMAHAAVHSGNPDNPLPAPPDTVAQLADRIADINRRRYAGTHTHTYNDRYRKGHGFMHNIFHSSYDGASGPVGGRRCRGAAYRRHAGQHYHRVQHG